MNAQNANMFLSCFSISEIIKNLQNAQNVEVSVPVDRISMI
jgi:hypothetical protein